MSNIKMKVWTCDYEKDGDLGLLIKENGGFIFFIMTKMKIWNYSCGKNVGLAL
jgi:hypothetical protein